MVDIKNGFIKTNDGDWINLSRVDKFFVVPTIFPEKSPDQIWIICIEVCFSSRHIQVSENFSTCAEAKSALYRAIAWSRD